MSAPRKAVERGLKAIAEVIQRRDPEAVVEIVPPNAAEEPEHDKDAGGVTDG